MAEETSPEQPGTVVEGGETPEEGAEPEKVEEPSKEVEQPSQPVEEARDVKPERTYTQEEWSKRESALNEQTAKERTARIAAESTARQVEATRSSDSEYTQILQNLAMQETQKVREATEQGLDPTLIKESFERERRSLGIMYQNFQAFTQQEQSKRLTDARDLIYKHGLSEQDMPTLLSTGDMDATARLIKAERQLNDMKVEKAKAAKLPQEFSAPTPSGIGDGEDEFVKRYASPDYIPTPADDERMQKIRDKY
jgi:hypothetical protein